MSYLLTEEMRAFLQSVKDERGMDLTQELCTFLRSMEDARGTPEDAKARRAGYAFFKLLKDTFKRRGWSVDDPTNAPPIFELHEEDLTPRLTRA